MGIESLTRRLRTVADAVVLRLDVGGINDAVRVTAVETLREEISAACHALLKPYRLCGPPSESVYVTHYTNLRTVQGILEAAGSDPAEAVLRRYSSSRFNDPEEGTLLLQALQRSDSLPHEVPKWLTSGEPRSAYIASFVAPSTSGDSPADRPRDRLRYWRYYGDDGAGCSLYVPVERRLLHRVRYGEKHLEGIVSDLTDVCNALSRVLDLSPGILPAYGPWIRARLTQPIMDFLGTVRFLHKTDQYQDEEECRVLDRKSESSDSLRFHVTNDDESMPDIRPYRLDPDLHARRIFATGAIITLGPRVRHREDIRMYFEHLLRESKISGPLVKFSEINYRLP